MSESDVLLRYYDERLEEHGDCAKGAGWPNEADRQLRFSVMQDVAAGRPALDSVCDVACGTGEFLSFLKNRGLSPRRYVGIDRSEKALAIARGKHPGASFVTLDLAERPFPGEPFDYAIANGLFTVKSSLSDEAMWHFMTTCVRAMWAMASVAIAFNVMSAVVDWQREDLFHVETDRLLAFLYGLAGRRVVIRADYGLYEYTAYVFRPSPASR